MNLESPERLKAIIKPHECSLGTLYLRKLTIAEWRLLRKQREVIVKSEDDERDGFVWGALALSKQLCDEGGNRIYDTDEWRAKFTELSASEMGDLLLAATEWTGVVTREGEQKKS